MSKQNAGRVHFGRKAAEIREKFPHRFIGSRFVLTRKPMGEGQEVDPNNLETFLVDGVCWDILIRI